MHPSNSSTTPSPRSTYRSAHIRSITIKSILLLFLFDSTSCNFGFHRFNSKRGSCGSREIISVMAFALPPSFMITTSTSTSTSTSMSIMPMISSSFLSKDPHHHPGYYVSSSSTSSLNFYRSRITTRNVNTSKQRHKSRLFMAENNSNNDNNKINTDDEDDNRKYEKKSKKKKSDDIGYETYDGNKSIYNTTFTIHKKKSKRKNNSNENKTTSIAPELKDDADEDNLLLDKRLKQLECLVSSQTVEIRRLKQECRDLNEIVSSFAQVIELLRQAGLSTSSEGTPPSSKDSSSMKTQTTKTNSLNSNNDNIDNDEIPSEADKRAYEYFDDREIFGSAPTSVIDAADSAGAAILAAMLGGKLRMLVDVRDAELSRDDDILVQFIELAILPVAAGLEGLTSERNHRVKIVFPTVSQLLQYRKSMALSAPEVVALSTLGFDSVEDSDNLVVVIAPRPDDEEGMNHLSQLLNPSNIDDQLRQPVVVVNYHMIPFSDLDVDFEKVYHLRLLSVQYMTGDMNPEYIQKITGETNSRDSKDGGDADGDAKGDAAVLAAKERTSDKDDDQMNRTSSKLDEDAALEAAVEHAHQIGVAQGITRAMVIRAYPRPWHVFVDTSPDADTDFEVAATFDEEPSQDEVNFAIVECLEGSEREDELVAQQMQEALEAGQLNRISDMFGGLDQDDIDDDDDDDYYFDLFNEDSC